MSTQHWRSLGNSVIIDSDVLQLNVGLNSSIQNDKIKWTKGKGLLIDNNLDRYLRIDGHQNKGYPTIKWIFKPNILAFKLKRNNKI